MCCHVTIEKSRNPDKIPGNMSTAFVSQKSPDEFFLSRVAVEYSPALRAMQMIKNLHFP